MRPSQAQVLGAVRASLNETITPAVTDRWARYVATAMDLVLQHLERRLDGEISTLEEDNADMATTLAAIVGRAADQGRAADGDHAANWAALADLAPTDVPDEPEAANESLRSALVGVLRWADEQGAGMDQESVEAVRDEALRLVRRQVDRMATFVEPLYMQFGPVSNS